MGDTASFVFDMIPMLLKASIGDTDTDTIRFFYWTFTLWNWLNYEITKSKMGKDTYLTIYLKHILTFNMP